MSGRTRSRATIAAITFVAFAATAVYALPLDRFFVMPDELVYAKTSLAIWHSPPLVGPGSDWFVSWSELAPLGYSLPLGALGDPVDGLRLAHGIAAATMALTAIPVYVLARDVTGDRRAGYMAAALSVSVPWMAMSASLMTEVFAYPAMAWAACAAVRACAQPSPGRDAHAVIAAAVAVLARAQLAFVPIALILAVVVCSRRQRRDLREHRLLLAVCLLVLTALTVRVSLGGGLASVLGDYASLNHQRGFSLAIGGRLIAYIGVAIGAVPLILGLPWIAASLRRRAPTQLGFGVFACVSLTAVVFQASLELSQPGRLQDRYLIYALPLVFIAMTAALLEEPRRVGMVAVVGLAFAVLVSRYDFFEAGAELTSLSFAFHEPIKTAAFNSGLDPGLFVGSLIVALTGLLTLWLRTATSRLTIVGLCVLTFCIAETAYTLRQMHQTSYVYGYVEPRPRDWVDRLVPPGSQVALLVTQAGNPLRTPISWWDVGFWNKSVERLYIPPWRGAQRWGQPATRVLDLDAQGHPRDERVWWVVSVADPRVRVVGGRAIARAGVLELRQASRESPLRLIR
ncbi:MAG: hypothetical protein QOJ29_1718 [Thermoleophilaceae bacterium]|nr:hypothetical protein [Thermoleophilaceae bacterium]